MATRKRRPRSQPQRVRRQHADAGVQPAMANGRVAVPRSRMAAAAPRDKVVALVTRPSPEARATAAVEANRCAKCRSTFVMREPAFLHCFYCGAMTRISAGSLREQELFELRSGLRLAS